VPGATEVVAALDLADQLVGISHECDYPLSIRETPVMIQPVMGRGHPLSAEVDREVKALVAARQPLYRLDEKAFRLAQPDLILTQDLCHVCAVTPDHLRRAIGLLGNQPHIVTLNPTTLEEMIREVERIGTAVGRVFDGHELASRLRKRLQLVRAQAAPEAARPRVVCLEWLDPLYLAGHWVPEMVSLAGGQDVLGQSGLPSRETTWEEVAEAKPDMLIVMPCGYSIERTMEELARPGRPREQWMRALERWPDTFVVEAASYFSRPGPRLVDGVELLAAMFRADSLTTLDRTKVRRLAATAFVTEAGS